mmetsp:Transcript_8986/g.19879  ORF Transcript_8986/g.19879 Transcript_8986/m.19879 type:complete len:198 (+) Transcript_8986:407-1000(+)
MNSEGRTYQFLALSMASECFVHAMCNEINERMVSPARSERPPSRPSSHRLRPGPSSFPLPAPAGKPQLLASGGRAAVSHEYPQALSAEGDAVARRRRPGSPARSNPKSGRGARRTQGHRGARAAGEGVRIMSGRLVEHPFWRLGFVARIPRKEVYFLESFIITGSLLLYVLAVVLSFKLEYKHFLFTTSIYKISCSF